MLNNSPLSSRVAGTPSRVRRGAAMSSLRAAGDGDDEELATQFDLELLTARVAKVCTAPAAHPLLPHC